MLATRRVVLVTAGIVHPSLRSQWHARRAFASVTSELSEDPDTTVRLSFAFGIRSLRRACESRPDLIAVYLHRPRADRVTVASLCGYVLRGGSLLGLHSASASFKGDAEYHDLLGGSFTQHGPIRQLRMTRCESVPEGVDSLPARVEMTDEPYEHTFSREVCEWYRWDDRLPAAWSHDYGGGRVGYLAPGHRASVWRSEAYRIVVRGMVRWLLRRGR
jgi:type 1 glutamine amidotransferase